eukprot:366507-Chlamydomonas_euryale.AAC.2
MVGAARYEEDADTQYYDYTVASPLERLSSNVQQTLKAWLATGEHLAASIHCHVAASPVTEVCVGRGGEEQPTELGYGMRGGKGGLGCVH